MPDLEQPAPVQATEVSATEVPNGSELLLGLDPTQQQAVLSGAPLLAIIAGAGSGKTGVLTRRVAYRCLTESTDSRHVVVLTFTRQAAGELRRRLRSLGLRDNIMSGTFHSVAYSLLRQRWDDQGRRHPVLIQDRRRLIGEVLGPRSSSDINTISTEIDWARARNLTPSQYASAARYFARRTSAAPSDVARVLSDINALKHKRGVIDLDDLLSLTIEALSTDPSFAESTRWRLRHFYVDEAQDLNPLQVALLNKWLDGREDLTLVGDPSQAIFGFNGADSRLLTDLENTFPGIEVVRLTTNYRCTPQIVQAGLTALSNDDSALPDLHSARPDGSPVEIYGFEDETSEAAGIASLVSSLRQDHRPWREFAVLTRTNAQLPVIRDALELAGIPARLMTTQAHDPLRRVVREVEDLPSAIRLSVWAKDVWNQDVLARESSGQKSPDQNPDQNNPAFNSRVAATADIDSAESGLAEMESLDTELRRRVARAVEEFLSDGGGDGRAFGAWVRANRPFEGDVRSDAVELLTFHSAKGREWDHVVVAGCEQGLVPHSSARTPLESAEEVRLTYVALTRAADRLVLTYARNRRGRSRERSSLIEGLNVRPTVSAPDPQLSQAYRARRSVLLPSDPVLEELEAWRSAAGRAVQLAPQVFCPDDVLSRIAILRPRTEPELAAIEGVGSLLAGRVGVRILEAVSRGLQRRDADVPD